MSLVTDPESPPCPHEWVAEYVVGALDLLWVKGNISEFYAQLSEENRNAKPFAVFAREISSAVGMFGKIETIGSPSEPKRRAGWNDQWVMNVPMFAPSGEFFVRIAVSEGRQVEGFLFGRRPRYTPPEYLRHAEAKVEEVDAGDDVVIVKPRGLEDFPVLLLLHLFPGTDVQYRMGQSFLGRDWEFLPIARIGIVRAAARDPDPEGTWIRTMCARMLQKVASLPGRHDVFLLAPVSCAFWSPEMVAASPMRVRGVVLVNPIWTAPVEGMGAANVGLMPADVRVLVIRSQFAMLPPMYDPAKEFGLWKSWAEKRGGAAQSFEGCETWLLATDHPPSPMDYASREFHISDVVMRAIGQWIRAVVAS